MDMNYEKYKNDGWGLSLKTFKRLEKLVSDIGKSQINVIEFGSGISTQFFCDLGRHLNKEITIYSFDNDTKYSYKGEDKNVKLFICPLEYTDDNSVDKMFDSKIYDKSFFKLKKDNPTTRQKNTFYRIDLEMLPNNFDICVLDGPHGNGRSLGFLHLKRISKCENSYILIDDHTHYDFESNLKKVFNIETIERDYDGKLGYENQVNYSLHQILM